MTVPKPEGFLVENAGNRTKGVGEERGVRPIPTALLSPQAPRLITAMEMLVGQHMGVGAGEGKAG